MPNSLTIADYIYLVGAHELVYHNETTRLEPQVASLLLYLATRAGETVSRETLMKELWPDVIVSDEALTNAVTKLRRAFNDNRANPQVIETIPKTGYRLIAKVSPSPPTPTDNNENIYQPPDNTKRKRTILLTTALGIGILLCIGIFYLLQEAEKKTTNVRDESLTTINKPSIAVLPLTNLSNDLQQDYFIDGITEDLITDLSKISGLHVISRNSVFSYKGLSPTPQEVAQQLGASYILEGSVQKEAELVRINVKLIDTTTGFNLWADRLDGSLNNVFDLQDNLARKVVAALAIELTEKEQDLLTKNKTSSIEALKHYFLGRAYFGSTSKQENDLSRKMYLRAIELDPQYAQAYAALAFTHIDDERRGWSTEPGASIEQAFKYARQAISINDAIPQAHFTLGYIHLYTKSEHDAAIIEAKKAIKLDPNYPDAYTLLSSAYFFSGYPEKSLPLDRQAMRLNPVASFMHYMHQGRSLYIQGRYTEAALVLQKAVERNSTQIQAHLWLAATYAQMGNFDEAEWEKELVFTLNPEFSISNWVELRLYKNQDHKKPILEGLEKAGITK